MDWDIRLDDQDEAAAPEAAYERQRVEEGTHELQVERVTQEDWGLKLALAHEDKRYGWVWCNIRRGEKQGEILSKQFLRSLGITSAEWRTTDPGDLVGRRLRAEIVHRVDKAGTLWVNVWKFLPTIEHAGQPAQAKPKPAPQARKTPAQQVKEASPAVAQHDDDIPF